MTSGLARSRMDPDSLVDWFTAHNGTFDRAALTFAPIDNLGWGAFALRDLQVLQTRSTCPVLTSSLASSHPLLSPPRLDSVHPHVLSSPFDWRGRLEEAWPSHRLARSHPLPHVGSCSRRILQVVYVSWCACCRSTDASPHLPIQDALPITFDTPIFWSSEDLEQLKGTAVLGLSISHMAIACELKVLPDKIGKEQAENDYANKVAPLLRVRALGNLSLNLMSMLLLRSEWTCLGRNIRIHDFL